MGNQLKLLVITVAFTAAASTAALAQYPCPPGYTLYGGTCQPAATPYPAPPPAPGYYAPSNPVSGAAQGAAAGAAAGGAAGGPVGAVIGGAIGTATGTVAGTANAVAGAPVAPLPSGSCAAGYYYYNGNCYPR
jgi:hypothetical protein